MHEIGKALVVVGTVIAVCGLLLWKTGGLGPLGRFPGDISIRGPHSSFYFPIVTCIVISVVLTFLSWLFRR